MTESVHQYDHELYHILAENQRLRAALEHVLAVLPGPVWNAHGVLVWSLLDIEQLETALKEGRHERSDNPARACDELA